MRAWVTVLVLSALLSACSASRPAPCPSGADPNRSASIVAGRVLVGVAEVIVGTDLVDHRADARSACADVGEDRPSAARASDSAHGAVASTPRERSAVELAEDAMLAAGTAKVPEGRGTEPPRRPESAAGGSAAVRTANAVARGSKSTSSRASVETTRPAGSAAIAKADGASAAGTAAKPEAALAAGAAGSEGAPQAASTQTTAAQERTGRWILVRKRERTLVVLDGDRRVKAFPVVLGADPVDAKRYEGDRRTPEGEYHVIGKHMHPEWQRFLLLDYPNPNDRQVYAWQRMKGLVPARGGHVPGTGGAIGIHGTAADALNRGGVNWTWGCISLLSRDIQELYNLVSVGTLVVIEH